MARILFADDDRNVRVGITSLLESEGYEVVAVKDGDEAVDRFDAVRPDLVLLDIMMPKMCGIPACAAIRKRDALVPIIFITANPNEATLVRGLDKGADDYMSKDCSSEEILARIRRALARQVVAAEARKVYLGDVVANVRTLVVSDGACEIARLTRSEADILDCLNRHRGELVSFDDIITDLRGNDYACEDSLLYSLVSRLRTKLGKAGELITSTRGVGYMLLP